MFFVSVRPLILVNDKRIEVCIKMIPWDDPNLVSELLIRPQSEINALGEK